MFKEYKLSKNKFIGGWFIPSNICNNLVNYFKKNKEKTIQGNYRSQKGIITDKKIKESIDLGLFNNTDKQVTEYMYSLQKCLDLYIKKYPEVNRYARFNVENLCIQHYPKNGGYKVWHFERGNKENAKRVLVFMTYLNNVKKGGTYFKYQKTLTPAKKGLTLIWPTDFTHTHKGQITNNEKTIITGWFAFI